MSYRLTPSGLEAWGVPIPPTSTPGIICYIVTFCAWLHGSVLKLGAAVRAVVLSSCWRGPRNFIFLLNVKYVPWSLSQTAWRNKTPCGWYWVELPPHWNDKRVSEKKSKGLGDRWKYWSCFLGGVPWQHTWFQTSYKNNAAAVNRKNTLSLQDPDKGESKHALKWNLYFELTFLFLELHQNQMTHSTTYLLRM